MNNLRDNQHVALVVLREICQFKSVPRGCRISTASHPRIAESGNLMCVFSEQADEEEADVPTKSLGFMSVLLARRSLLHNCPSSRCGASEPGRLQLTGPKRWLLTHTYTHGDPAHRLRQIKEPEPITYGISLSIIPTIPAPDIRFALRARVWRT